MVLHRYLKDSKAPRVSRTFLRVQADFKCVVVWMVSILHHISSDISIFRPLGTILNVPSMLDINVIIFLLF